MIIEISMAEILKIGTDGSFWKMANRGLFWGLVVGILGTIKDLKSIVDLQNLIPGKGFKFFATFLIYPQNSRRPFSHFADDSKRNRIFSEGLLNRQEF